MRSTDADVEAVLSRRNDNGADFWSTPDGRIYVGNPFSTISSLGILHELGVPADHEAVQGGLELIVESCRDDGRVRVGPKAPLTAAPLAFCARGSPSSRATARYREIDRQLSR